ncbi:MAG TPA: ATP-binding protein [Bacteroidales bacterium]|nr:ATP-binding protein [Bacteroidales bacterium]
MKFRLNYTFGKQNSKWFLLAFAAIFTIASFLATDKLINRIADDERLQVQLWAEAVEKRANLVNYTTGFFSLIKEEELKRVELWANANRRIAEMPLTESIDLIYIEILEANTTIPLLITDSRGNVLKHRNLDHRLGNPTVFTPELQSYFSEYEPIVITSDLVPDFEPQFLYYKDSYVFTELRSLLNDLIHSFISEVVINTANVPVIIVDSTLSRLIAAGNVEIPSESDTQSVKALIQSFYGKNTPITITLPNYGKSQVLYANSFLLTQLKFYPFVQITVLGLFLLVAYLLFTTIRNSEQNKIWVGMSKETAHQLGTPVSSLEGWMEVLKMRGVDLDVLNEMAKDVSRLGHISERFSKIGSSAKLEPVNIVETTTRSVEYMKTRTSKKVQFTVTSASEQILVPLNSVLYEWVVENLVKNAIDAMNGRGLVTIQLEDGEELVKIDFADTGKGIPRSKFKDIFIPGYTSKHKGWGLGLSLCKRIIENYHGGKLFVSASELNKGSVFRIILKKKHNITQRNGS